MVVVRVDVEVVIVVAVLGVDAGVVEVRRARHAAGGGVLGGHPGAVTVPEDVEEAGAEVPRPDDVDLS